MCDDVGDDVGDDVVFSVPTGGCGNLAAGVIVKLMGLPVKFIVAVNHNDLLDPQNNCNGEK